jgi:hypothetical protein
MYNFSFKRYFVNGVINEMKVYIITEYSVIDVRRLVAEQYILFPVDELKRKMDKLSKNVFDMCNSIGLHLWNVIFRLF